MAGGCWLPKVIVVFALLFRINYAHFDDLLDRVRVSKSNEPEVREFLKSVLKHHGDFRWISHEAAKLHLDDQGLLPLHGVSPKSKRSFYTSSGGYPLMRKYGYRYESDPVVQRQQGSFLESEHEQSQSQPQQEYAEDVDFDGPVNDVYPYRDDVNVPQSDHRFARETQDTFLYDERHMDENDDFLDEMGPDGENVAEFVSEDRPDSNSQHFELDYTERRRVPESIKRAATPEELLNEKLWVHKLLHKDMGNRNNRNGVKNSWKKMIPLGLHMPGDTIEIIPGSEKGVRYAPGTKYEKFGEFAMADQEEYDEPVNHKLIKRKCSDTLEDHDFKVPELFGPNASQTSEVDVPLAEFYYLQPHDVLGMNQDVMNEQRDTFNVSCKKYKRAIHWDDLVDRQNRKRKAIKIKIFDDSELVKDIQKGRGVNSLILTIKNEKRGTFRPSTVTPRVSNTPAYSTDVDSAYYHDLNLYSNNLIGFKTDGKDNTLQKIDRILKQDEASLKLNSPFPESVKHNPELEDELFLPRHKAIDEHIFGSLKGSNQWKDVKQPGHPAHSSFNSNQASSGKYHRVNEMGTTVVPLINFRGKSTFSDEDLKPNRLEDQTEPTSAAEQRELGRINNNFNTQPVNMQTATEKIFIVPLKKSAKSHSTQLHLSKMSHKYSRESNKLSADKNMEIRIMVDNKLKESEDVLGKLRNDLEQTLKGNIQRDDDNRDLRQLLKNLQHSPTIKEEVEKRSNDAENIISPKAVAFRSRKLFSIDENNNIEDGQENIQNDKPLEENPGDSSNRYRKDIRKVLGMRNDEDYSEDKSDFCEGDKKSQLDKSLKQSSNIKSDYNHIKNLLLGSLISSSQERKALKTRLARTKSSKVKKDVLQDVHLAPAEEGDDNSNVQKRDNYQHLIIKDHEQEWKTARKSESQEERNPSEDDLNDHIASDRNADRCCENDQKGNSTCSGGFGDGGGCADNKSGDALPVQNDGDPCGPASSAGSPKTGNELDIIEKTQAILLHLTGSPNGEAVTSRGEFDESEDHNSKVNDPGLTVKRLNSFKVNDNTERYPDDVVSEIIKLVQNYKSRVDQNNKDAGEKLTNTENSVKEETHALNKNKQPINLVESSSETTTIGKGTTDIGDKVITGDDEDDVAVHAHALPHAKKLHPVESNKCNVKPGNDVQNVPELAAKNIDQDQEFVVPIAVKEGYAKPEVVADSDSNDGENLTEVHPDDEIKKNQKRDQQDQDQENPMKFTPDNFDSFKQIVETEKRTKSRDVDSGSKNVHEARVKRDIDSEYTDDEIDKLLSMVDDASTSMKDERNRRYRRYKNYEPYFRKLPRYRQVENPSSTSEVSSESTPTTMASNGDKASATTVASSPATDTTSVSSVSTQAALCIDNENQRRTTESGCEKNIKKKHKCDSKDADEYGDTCNMHAENHKKSKSQLTAENKVRERTRDKIYQDKISDKQKEQEHIKNVLNGHLVIELMEKFQNRLKENEHLNSRFGQSMGKKCANDEVSLIDQFREEQSKSDIRHAQLMLHQVIVLMNRIVAEQVHRRTCLTLSPALKSYLKKIAANAKSMSGKSLVVAEGFPLPAIKGPQKENQIDEKQGDFLFPPTEDEDKKETSPVDAAFAMRKKINMIKALLNKYNHMSHNCQVRVEPVREYLVQHLKTLEKLNHEKNYAESNSDVCAPKCMNSDASAAPSGASSSVGVVTTATDISASNGSPSPPTTSPVTAANPVARSAVLYEDPYLFKRDNLFDNYNDDTYKFGDRNKHAFLSDKYKKLVDAAATYRRKRQIEERLARLFGKNKDEGEDTTNRAEYNMDAEELSNVAFEAPMVYSLH